MSQNTPLENPRGVFIYNGLTDVQGVENVLDKSQLLVMDCEASGLDEASYPISIGVSGPEKCAWYWLLSPLEGWDHWDPNAEDIHGIDSEMLLSLGRDPFFVAREMNAVFKEKALVVDSQWDIFWIKRLFDDCGVTMAFSLVLINDLFDQGMLTRYHSWQESHDFPHHALQDACAIRSWIVENAPGN